MKKVYMTYEEWEGHCLTLAEQVREYNPTEIIAVARGGVMPAFIIAKRLGLKIGMWYPADAELFSHSKDRLLFVDDIVSTGRTLLRLHECFRGTGLNYKTAALFVDKQDAATTPDFYSFFADDWIVLPYHKPDQETPGVRIWFRDTDDYQKGASYPTLDLVNRSQ